jgi:hypothetical protein
MAMLGHGHSLPVTRQVKNKQPQWLPLLARSQELTKLLCSYVLCPILVATCWRAESQLARSMGCCEVGAALLIASPIADCSLAVPTAESTLS